MQNSAVKPSDLQRHLSQDHPSAAVRLGISRRVRQVTNVALRERVFRVNDAAILCETLRSLRHEQNWPSFVECCDVLEGVLSKSKRFELHRNSIALIACLDTCVQVMSDCCEITSRENFDSDAVAKLSVFERIVLLMNSVFSTEVSLSFVKDHNVCGSFVSCLLCMWREVAIAAKSEYPSNYRPRMNCLSRALAPRSERGFVSTDNQFSRGQELADLALFIASISLDTAASLPSLLCKHSREIQGTVAQLLLVYQHDLLWSEALKLVKLSLPPKCMISDTLAMSLFECATHLACDRTLSKQVVSECTEILLLLKMRGNAAMCSEELCKKLVDRLVALAHSLLNGPTHPGTVQLVRAMLLVAAQITAHHLSQLIKLSTTLLTLSDVTSLVDAPVLQKLPLSERLGVARTALQCLCELWDVACDEYASSEFDVVQHVQTVFVGVLDLSSRSFNEIGFEEELNKIVSLALRTLAVGCLRTQKLREQTAECLALAATGGLAMSTTVVETHLRKLPRPQLFTDKSIFEVIASHLAEAKETGSDSKHDLKSESVESETCTITLRAEDTTYLLASAAKMDAQLAVELFQNITGFGWIVSAFANLARPEDLHASFCSPTALQGEVSSSLAVFRNTSALTHSILRCDNILLACPFDILHSRLPVAFCDLLDAVASLRFGLHRVNDKFLEEVFTSTVTRLKEVYNLHLPNVERVLHKWRSRSSLSFSQQVAHWLSQAGLCIELSDAKPARCEISFDGKREDSPKWFFALAELATMTGELERGKRIIDDMSSSRAYALAQLHASQLFSSRAAAKSCSKNEHEIEELAADVAKESNVPQHLAETFVELSDARSRSASAMEHCKSIEAHVSSLWRQYLKKQSCEFEQWAHNYICTFGKKPSALESWVSLKGEPGETLHSRRHELRKSRLSDSRNSVADSRARAAVRKQVKVHLEVEQSTNRLKVLSRAKKDASSETSSSNELALEFNTQLATEVLSETLPSINVVEKTGKTKLEVPRPVRQRTSRDESRTRSGQSKGGISWGTREYV
ncbi:MAG: hypothetical protein MHM6MM_001172 [Cercozoa sp. M6MM]